MNCAFVHHPHSHKHTSCYCEYTVCVYARSDLVRAKAPDFGDTEIPASPIPPPTPHERWCMHGPWSHSAHHRLIIWEREREIRVDSWDTSLHTQPVPSAELGSLQLPWVKHSTVHFFLYHLLPLEGCLHCLHIQWEWKSIFMLLLLCIHSAYIHFT